MSGVPFLSKPVCKRVRVGPSGSARRTCNDKMVNSSRQIHFWATCTGHPVTHRIPKRKGLNSPHFSLISFLSTLFVDPYFFSENDHESWFKGSINLFSCFVFPCRSCDNTLVDWTSTFHSNFVLFPCIGTMQAYAPSQPPTLPKRYKFWPSDFWEIRANFYRTLQIF